MNRCQFSTRSLLVLTAIVSVVLAVAVRMPAVFQVALMVAAPVLFVVAIFQSANFATSDRRPRLALVAWTALGSFFAIYSFAIYWFGLQGQESVSAFAVVLFCVMAGCCLICLAEAWRSFNLIGASRSDADSTGVQTPESAGGRTNYEKR